MSHIMPNFVDGLVKPQFCSLYKSMNKLLHPSENYGAYKFPNEIGILQQNRSLDAMWMSG